MCPRSIFWRSRNISYHSFLLPERLFGGNLGTKEHLPKPPSWKPPLCERPKRDQKEGPERHLLIPSGEITLPSRCLGGEVGFRADLSVCLYVDKSWTTRNSKKTSWWATSKHNRKLHSKRLQRKEGRKEGRLLIQIWMRMSMKRSSRSYRRWAWAGSVQKERAH